MSLSKLQTLEAMERKRAEIRARGEKLVFTNGVFDLLHPGHVRYLAAARSLGDYLLVAVNADRTVARLKGEGRPLVPLEERMEILAALEAVDFVMPFEEDTPERVIGALVPDVLVKGGDWPVDRIAGREIVEAGGGRVVSLPFRPGQSTTGIIETILERFGEKGEKG